MSRGRTSQSPDPIQQGLASIQDGINNKKPSKPVVYKDAPPQPQANTAGLPGVQGVGSPGMVDPQEQDEYEKARMRLRNDLQEQQQYDMNQQMGGPQQYNGPMVS